MDKKAWLEEEIDRTKRIAKFEEAVRMMEAIQSGQCSSFWLKDALRTAWERDCVDALRDAETLARLLKLKCEYFQEKEVV